MMKYSLTLKVVLLGGAVATLACLSQVAFALTPGEAVKVQRATPDDHSGKKRKGKASYYHGKFAGKKMADGTRMDPQSNNAASKTLPLGTTAKVTNLDNGKSVVVKIKDRGPYVANRIVDLSPKSAEQIGMKKDGVVPVEVAPIAVPQPNGDVKPGSGANESSGQVPSR